MNTSRFLFTSQVESKNMDKIVNLAKMKQALAAVRAAQHHANIMWGLTRAQQLWLPELEAELKRVWGDQDRVLADLWEILGNVVEVNGEGYRLGGLKSFVRSARILYADIFEEYKHIWRQGIYPGYPLRLDTWSTEMLHTACQDWHHHAMNVFDALDKLLEQNDSTADDEAYADGGSFSQTALPIEFSLVDDKENEENGEGEGKQVPETKIVPPKSKRMHSNRANKKRQPRSGPLSEAEKQKRRAEGLCFYCGEPGHMIDDCEMRCKNNHKRATKADFLEVFDATAIDWPELPAANHSEDNIRNPHPADIEWDKIPVSKQSKEQKHACLHWSGCYDDTCRVHLDGKITG